MPILHIPLTKTDVDRLSTLAERRGSAPTQEFAASLLHHAIQRAWEAEKARARECAREETERIRGELGISKDTAARMRREYGAALRAKGIEN